MSNLNKYHIYIFILAMCIGIVCGFFATRYILRMGYDTGYESGYAKGFDDVSKWLVLSYDEKEYPTNCSMDKFPIYLTVDDISKSDMDNNRTFWIMMVSESQWICEKGDDYGLYGNIDNWCHCKFVGRT